MQGDLLPRNWPNDWGQVSTPSEANGMIRSAKRLFNWAIDEEMLEVNPAIGIRLLRTGPGYEPWEGSEIEAFRKCWPIGTLPRTMVELQFGTAQRRSDVIRIQWRHVRAGYILVPSQKKTGERVEIPISGELAEALKSWPRGAPEDCVLKGAKGGALKPRRYSELLAQAVKEAGLPKSLTSHGLRYAAAGRLLELGTPLNVIAMITGHQTSRMVEKYAYRRRATQEAVYKIDAHVELLAKKKVSNGQKSFSVHYRGTCGRNHLYTAGRMSSVKAVDVTSPPTTTVASGR